jgi:Flp pilus assembly protein TadD
MHRTGLLVATTLVALVLPQSTEVLAGPHRDEVCRGLCGGGCPCNDSRPYGSPYAPESSPYQEAYNQGLRLHHARRHEEALAYFRRALELRPNDPLALAYVGVSLRNVGRMDEAEPYLRRAISPGVADYIAHAAMGVVLGNLNRFGEAELYLRRAARFDPTPERYNNLGWVLGNLGRLREAEAAYRAAVRIDPTYELGRRNVRSMAEHRAARDRAHAHRLG